MPRHSSARKRKNSRLGDREWEGVEKDKVFMEENVQEKPYIYE